MQYQRKHSGKAFILALITIMALLLMVIMSTYAFDVAAQTPLNVDLAVNKTANVSTIASGGYVTYIITIDNNGADDADVVLFRDNYPTGQMLNVSFDFSQPATSDGHIPPEWWFDDPILAGDGAVVTVTGQLVAIPGTVIVNTAEATAFGETNSADNTDEASVTISGGSGSIIYLPVIHRNPLPAKILVYYEDFNSGEPWFEFDNNGCNAYHSNDQYWVDLDNGKECLPPARNENNPQQPYRTYGEFEVTAYVSGEYLEDDHWYGIFINGAGGDDYYRFRIKPNEGDCSSGGDWELMRRKNNSNKTLASRSCDANIRRGYGSGAANKLAIRHTYNHQLLVYINDVLVQTVTLISEDRLSGTATGVYISTIDSNRNMRTKFDDFRVYSLP